MISLTGAFGLGKKKTQGSAERPNLIELRRKGGKVLSPINTATKLTPHIITTDSKRRRCLGVKLVVFPIIITGLFVGILYLICF
jgi:hypothetical protein